MGTKSCSRKRARWRAAQPRPATTAPTICSSAMSSVETSCRSGSLRSMSLTRRSSTPEASSDKQREDDKLDEALDETFPASDPPANTVETGIRLSPAVDVPISDNAAQSQFELTVDGHTAYLKYERSHDTLTLVHTEVPPEIRGRHLGD